MSPVARLTGGGTFATAAKADSDFALNTGDGDNDDDVTGVEEDELEATTIVGAPLEPIAAETARALIARYVYVF